MSMQREPGRALKALPQNALFSFGRPVLHVGRRMFSLFFLLSRYFFFFPSVILFDLLQRVLCANVDSKIAKSCSAIEVVLQNCA